MRPRWFYRVEADLLGAENAVPGIAETRDDIAVFIEVIINGGGIDIHIRVRRDAMSSFISAIAVSARAVMFASNFSKCSLNATA